LCRAGREFEDAVEHCGPLATDADAKYDDTLTLQARDLAPDGDVGNESGNGDAGFGARAGSGDV